MRNVNYTPRLILHILVFFILISVNYSQSFSVRTKVGYGNYVMTEMKEYQESIWDDIENNKIVDNFPGYLNFQLEVGYYINNKFFVGVLGAFASTGGKKTVSDYSGSIEVIQKLKIIQLGLTVEGSIYNNSLFSTYIGSHFLVGKTILSDSSAYFIGNSLRSNSMEYDGYSYSLEPFLSFGTQLYVFEIKIETGYNFCKPINLFSTEFENWEFEKTADWSGLRIGLLLEYSF